jgi:hypothetical protein
MSTTTEACEARATTEGDHAPTYRHHDETVVHALP